MRQLIETVTLEGQQVRVGARHPLPVGARALAMAAAIRVLERYPVLDRLTLAVGEEQVDVSRAEVDWLLGPDGMAQLKDRDGAREVLERVIREFAGEEAV
jgi:hypothetical protein